MSLFISCRILNWLYHASGRCILALLAFKVTQCGQPVNLEWTGWWTCQRRFGQFLCKIRYIGYIDSASSPPHTYAHRHMHSLEYFKIPRKKTVPTHKGVWGLIQPTCCWIICVSFLVWPAQAFILALADTPTPQWCVGFPEWVGGFWNFGHPPTRVSAHRRPRKNFAFL